MHKHRPFLKPFIAVAAVGHITDVFSPYTANTSDAQNNATTI